MFAPVISPHEQALSDVWTSVHRTRRAAPLARGDAAVDLIAGCLRAADALVALAVEATGRGGFENEVGLCAQTLLELEARRTGADARMITAAAATLREMPETHRAFHDGRIGWGEVRAIIRAVKVCNADGRGVVDRLAGSLASQGLDPDTLIGRVYDEIARQRSDLVRAKENRAVEHSYIAIIPRLDGSATIHGETDAQTTATFISALAAVPKTRVSRDEEDEITRPQQNARDFLRVCEGFLAGTSTGTRPKPLFLATINLDTLAQTGGPQARLLWGLPGRSTPLSRLAAEVLACDAEIQAVYFNAGQPVAVGKPYTKVTTKMRKMLIARDGGCRFPSCDAPVQWCIGHHIRHGRGGTLAQELILVCKRCHDRIHTQGWRIQLAGDGTATFRRGKRIYTSHPRAG